ncbi:hypothetical protein [Corallococcus exercitus]|uniref:Uncharacterized protein n=1 Tax=Corallococcus exercitus TaxID=2316736 RepID=A0A7Y4JNS6_9BACT|nr:hypothetical protein [Corallococcus exercitus]NOK08133.1 hypothetical protein [Corallococcus exercitus]
MKRILLGFFIGWFASLSQETLEDDADPPPEIPGGDCFWSVKEGGSECVVTIGIEARTRTAGTTDGINGVEGYGEKKWKCGETRTVCGSTVECTCPFPVTAPDGGS